MVFLDANILLEIVLGRDNESVARKFIADHQGDLYISALTAHLIVHFGKDIVDLPIIRKFLSDYTIIALESSDFDWAFINSRSQDFEDALQLGVAIRNGCSQFVTFDKVLATTYKSLPSIEIKLLS